MKIGQKKAAEKRKAPDAKTWQDAVKMRVAAKAKSDAKKAKPSLEGGKSRVAMCDAEEI